MLDTCVLASALRSRNGASRRLLDLVVDRKLMALATTALFLEYEDVLKRPDQRAVSGLTLAQVDRVLAGLANGIEPVDVRFALRPQLRDAGDEMVLDAAVNGRADALITHNLSDFEHAAPRFGLIVLSPGALLERMKT